MGKVVELPVGAPPTLADLARDLTRASQVPPDAIPALLAQCAALQSTLTARLLVASPAATVAASEDLLTVDQAAKRLATSSDWLYRRARSLPFAVHLGPRQLRFSAAGIARYIRQRQGA